MIIAAVIALAKKWLSACTLLYFVFCAGMHKIPHTNGGGDIVRKRKRNHTYQNILFDNVQQLANFIVGKRKDLQFVIPQVKIQRNDPLELQQKILAMSPTETKRRGINKSTLWYQKKNLARGNRIRVYEKIMSKLS